MISHYLLSILFVVHSIDGQYKTASYTDGGAINFNYNGENDYYGNRVNKSASGCVTNATYNVIVDMERVLCAGLLQNIYFYSFPYQNSLRFFIFRGTSLADFQTVVEVWIRNVSQNAGGSLYTVNIEPDNYYVQPGDRMGLGFETPNKCVPATPKFGYSTLAFNAALQPGNKFQISSVPTFFVPLEFAFAVKIKPGLIGAPGTIGNTGYTGLNGPIGQPGYAGIVGAVGNPGPTGPKGVIGGIGANGFPGQIGSKGYTGSAGSTGATGFTGFTGINGNVGAIGPQGSLGQVGATGNTGQIGAIGYPGPSAQNTLRGAVGDTGATGPNGFVGNTGPTGTYSYAGDIPLEYKGDTGPPGSHGQDGNQGQPGLPGSVNRQLDDGSIGTCYLPSYSGYDNYKKLRPICSGKPWPPTIITMNPTLKLNEKAEFKCVPSFLPTTSAAPFRLWTRRNRPLQVNQQNIMETTTMDWSSGRYRFSPDNETLIIDPLQEEDRGAWLNCVAGYGDFVINSEPSPYIMIQF